jgi:hypothetical protein
MTQLSLENSIPSINLNINTTQKIAAAELHIKFDPQFIKINSFNQGTFLTNPNIMDLNIDNTAGTANLTILSSLVNTVSGQGTIASLNITALKQGSTTISINDQTKIAAVGQGDNVLTSTSDLIINLTQADIDISTTTQEASPTPILRQTLTPSPTMASTEQKETDTQEVSQQITDSTYTLYVLTTAAILILTILFIALKSLIKNNSH